MRALQWAVVVLGVCVNGVLLSRCGILGDANVDFEDMGNNRALTPRKPVDEKPSSNDVQDVLRAWWVLKQWLPLRYLGTTILMTFLKLYPEYYKFYAEGKKEPVERLPFNKGFVEKSVSFIYEMTSMLDNLDDLELVELIAKRTGKRKGQEGENETSLDDLRNMILHLVARYRKQYVTSFPLGIEESTTRTLNWIFATQKKGLTPQQQPEKHR